LLPLIVGLAASGAVYGVAYFGLSYVMVRLNADATLSGAKENLPCAASQA